jgi:hypothetical protein
MRKLMCGPLLAVASASCTSQGDRVAEVGNAGERTDLRRLGGSEIRRLLVGQTVSIINEPGVLTVTSRSREIYRPDGSLLIEGDRGLSRGRYWIARHRLCFRLELASQVACRVLFRSNTNEYYLSPTGSQYARQRPVRIQLEN